MNRTGTAIGNQQREAILVESLEIFDGTLSNQAFRGHFIHSRHRVVIADYADFPLDAAINRGKGCTDSGDAMHRDVRLDGQTKIVKTLAGANFHQSKMLANGADFPTDAAGNLLHGHVKDFARGD